MVFLFSCLSDPKATRRVTKWRHIPFLKKTVIPGKRIVYEKRQPNTVKWEWALGRMRGCCGCTLQTQSGEHWSFKGGGHSHTLMWSNGKRLEEFIWLCLDVQRNQAGSRAGNGTHPPCLQETSVAEASGGQEPSAPQTAFQLLPLKAKTARAHGHLSQGESCYPATHLVQKWEGRRGKRRRECRTTQSYLAARLVKNLPAMREAQVRSLGREDPLEKGMATHSSVLGLPWWLSW